MGNDGLDPILEHLRRAAALWFWELGAIRVADRQPFRLASGYWSPIYINCRRVISEPAFLALFKAAARRLWSVHGIDAQALAGGETAGIPFAAVLASELSLPMVYVRKKAKGYGIASRVEGVVEEGARVVLVEDLITDGGSKLGFLEALGEVGGTVRDVLVLFDRQQGGGDLLARHGARLHAICDRRAALAAGRDNGYLDTDGLRSVERYFEDSAAWHTERGLEPVPEG